MYILIAFNAIPTPAAVEVTGAGSTFIYPLMAKWAVEYRDINHDVINYQSIGSGGGIKQIENRTVDFGATDVPLTADQLLTKGLIQIPLIAGAVVPVVHVRGINADELKLDGAALADIYLGQITRWNDPRLRQLNPDLNLPDRLITVVHRADGSGTSFIWTSYLASASEAWKTKVGAASAVTWPIGVGGKGNEGVASFVKQIDGAVGYVESAFAARAHLTTTTLRNRAGQFVPAEVANVGAALDAADWSGVAVLLINPAGARSWPIAGVTYLLMNRATRSTAAARATTRFVAWAFAHGEPSARRLHYASLPANVRRRGLEDLDK